MTDPIKLSELLETATNSIGAAARRDAKVCNTAALLWSQEAALRAIAPALVEAAEFITRQHSPPRKFPYCDCAGCVLTHEMEKAGVTCE